MRLISSIILATSIVTPAAAQQWQGGMYGSQSQHSVQGYTNQYGTFVQPHMQTNPNGTVMDNWSTKGNVNPYTGQPGYRNPY